MYGYVPWATLLYQIKTRVWCAISVYKQACKCTIWHVSQLVQPTLEFITTWFPNSRIYHQIICRQEFLKCIKICVNKFGLIYKLSHYILHEYFVTKFAIQKPCWDECWRCSCNGTVLCKCMIWHLFRLTQTSLQLNIKQKYKNHTRC